MQLLHRTHIPAYTAAEQIQLILMKPSAHQNTSWGWLNHVQGHRFTFLIGLLCSCLLEMDLYFIPFHLAQLHDGATNDIICFPQAATPGLKV